VEDGDEVICDWYDITEAPADDGTTDADTGGVTALPVTGAGPLDPSGMGGAVLLGALGLVAATCAIRVRRQGV
jgi:hypothetical protein